MALSAGMGPVGVFLASFGPWGLAAAAGVGLITAAFDYMIAESDRLADVAAKLREVSEVTGLSTDDLQKLVNAGANVGMSTQQVTQTFERFEVQLGSLRDATGPLYTNLMKVNPTLVAQIASTKDAATAWSLLAQAYAQADQQQQVLIAHAAAGGRHGGAGVGNLLATTAAAGGVGALQTPASSLANEQIVAMANLKIQIDATNQAAKDIYASLYAPEVLAAQKRAADYNLSIAQSLKAIADQKSGLSWFENFVNALSAYQQIGYGLPPQAAFTAPSSFADRFSGPPSSFADRFNTAGMKSDNPGTSAFTPLGQANQWKEYVAALGPAATATDDFNAKWSELYAKFQSGAGDLNTYNRALAGLQLQTAAQGAQAYVSALGPLATVQERVTATTDGLLTSQLKWQNLTPAQITQIRTMTTANDEWQRANEEAKAGIFDLATASAAVTDTLQTWKDQKLFDPNDPRQLAAANDILIARFIALKASAYDATPALKAFNQELFQQQTQFLSPGQLAAANAAKQIDPLNWTAHLGDAAAQMAEFNTNLKETVGLAGDFANSFGQAMLQGDNMTKALNVALNSLASSLISMISKQLVNQALGPLGNAVGGMLGLSPGSGSTLAPATLPSAATGAGISPFHTGGIVGLETGGPMRFVNPTMFIGAHRFHTGGIAGDEVPIIARRGEGVFTPGQMSAMGGGSVTNNIIIENNSGQPATQTQSQNSSGGTDTRIQIGAAMVERFGSGAMDKTMSARYGVTPVTQRR
ncbi:MAG TPA: hypothetical protein VFW56_08395 [Bradyrhizobium sp.]|nr:hypothetical protein [Bradyrhizobium sp.]